MGLIGIFVHALFDSNILINYLNGIEAAKRELGRYESRSVSVISWMEILAGAPAEAEAATSAFLDEFNLVGIDAGIARRAVRLRREKRLKLPDAVILATALEGGLLLVTRNVRDFDPDLPSVRMPHSV